jgi:hypothetical protein
MVEVRIIPEGIRTETKTGKFSKEPAKKIRAPHHVQVVRPSFEPQKRSKFSSSEGSCPTGKSYHKAVQGSISRMAADNDRENQKVRPKTVRNIMMAQLRAGDPSRPVRELETLVDSLLPIAMEKYKGPQALKPEITPELQKIWATNNHRRRKIVQANRLRRKEDQPMSKADRRWTEKQLQKTAKN